MALKGNPHAIRTACALAENAAAAKAAHLAEERRRWTSYQEKAWEDIQRAEEAGEKEPLYIPHPDDVVIEPDGEVTFAGPTTVEELAEMRGELILLAACLYQDALDKRLGSVPIAPQSKGECGYAIVEAVRVNRGLPARLRMSEDAFRREMDRLSKTPKRRLLKETRAAWKACGFDRKRGGTATTWAEMEPIVDAFYDAFRGVDIRAQSEERLGEIIAGALEKAAARRSDDGTGPTLKRGNTG